MLGIVLGLGFGGWDSTEAVHEALLVVPGDVVGGEVFDVALTVADQSASLDVGFFGDGDDDEKVTTFDLLDRRDGDV